MTNISAKNISFRSLPFSQIIQTFGHRRQLKAEIARTLEEQRVVVDRFKVAAFAIDKIPVPTSISVGNETGFCSFETSDLLWGNKNLVTGFMSDFTGNYYALEKPVSFYRKGTILGHLVLNTLWLGFKVIESIFCEGVIIRSNDQERGGGSL